jgi:predicted lipoprotein with Yx(FWY)xxD motif
MKCTGMRDGTPGGTCRWAGARRFNTTWLKVIMAFAACVLGALMLSACGGASQADGPYGSGSPIQPLKGPTYEVRAMSVGGLGTVLVDGEGFTLYLYSPDDHSSRSTCKGACADAWPPLVLPAGTSSPVAGPGVNSSLLGVTLRAGGKFQVTYNGWPLYTWIDDISPGLATGQGIYDIGGYWYAVGPNGAPNLQPNPSGFQ